MRSKRSGTKDKPSTTIEEKGDEHMEVSGASVTNLDDIPKGEIPSEEGKLIGAAKAVSDEGDAKPEQKGPIVKHYVVTRGGPVLMRGGYRTRLNEGKELDSLNFDIPKLTQQGIHLKEISAPNRGEGFIPTDDW